MWSYKKEAEAPGVAHSPVRRLLFPHPPLSFPDGVAQSGLFSRGSAGCLGTSLPCRTWWSPVDSNQTSPKALATSPATPMSLERPWGGLCCPRSEGRRGVPVARSLSVTDPLVLQRWFLVGRAVCPLAGVGCRGVKQGRVPSGVCSGAGSALFVCVARAKLGALGRGCCARLAGRWVGCLHHLSVLGLVFRWCKSCNPGKSPSLAQSLNSLTSLASIAPAQSRVCFPHPCPCVLVCAGCARPVFQWVYRCDLGSDLTS